MTLDSDRSGEDAEELSEKVVLLEKQLRAGGLRSVNVLCELIPLVRHSPAAAHAVRRVLAFLAKRIRSIKETSSSDELQSWLNERRREYVSCLAAVFSGSRAQSMHDARTGNSAEETALACAAVQGEFAWKSVLFAALRGKRVEIVSEFVAKYLSLRLWSLEVIASCVKKKKSENVSKSSENVAFSESLALLRACGRADPEFDYISDRIAPADGAEQLNAITPSRRKNLRRVFGDTWLCVLSHGDMDEDYRAECLQCMPSEIIPFMSNPLRLSDFLTDCFNNTSDIQACVSALDALFLLISDYRLDFPLFYPKLYSLLTPDTLFHAPKRQRFLQLTAMFLTKGSNLPRTMVAAFMKRLVRRALVAPPAGAMWCLRLALDLLRKHPSAAFLVHKTINLFEQIQPGDITDPGSRVSAGDPFNDEENDPLASGAEKSSLWELETLKTHMSPGVSRLVNAFTIDVRKTPAPLPGTLDDLSSLCFTDIFEAEFRHRAKSIPFAYEIPGTGSAAAAVDGIFSSTLKWC